MIQRGLIRRSGRGLHTTRRGMSTKGCLIALAVFFTMILIIGGVVSYVVAKNWRSWAGSGVEAMMVNAVDNSYMEDSEKTEVKAIIADVREDFVSGAITLEDLQSIGEGFANSPIVPATVASESYRQYYESNPDLTDDDKALGKLQLGRLARGIFEGSVNKSLMVAVLEPITAPKGTNGSGVQFEMNGIEVTLKEPAKCSVEELRQVTANAQKTCDEVGVPAEAFTIDISDELQKIVDKALGREPVEMLNTAPAATPDDEAEEAYDDAVGESPADDSGEPETDDGG